MPSEPVSHVRRQVAKANRRLFAQALLDSLVVCWAAALLLAAGWFLLAPWLRGAVDGLSRWGVAGGIFAAATTAAAWLTWRRMPSMVNAALELDHRFQLKERATTSLTLDPELAQTPAGQALMADAESHVAKVEVRKAFPVRLRWSALLVPVGAAGLAVVAVFYNPVVQPWEADAAVDGKKVVNAKDIAEKFNKFKKQAEATPPKEGQDEKLAEIEKLRDRLLDQPFDSSDKDKIRERLQQLLPLEDKIRNRVEDLKAQHDRNQAMQTKLKEMGQDPSRKLAKDGPAKDLEDALNKGDLDKAQKEILALAEQLKANKLNDEERKELLRQLDEIQKKLDSIADLTDMKQRLQKDLAEGHIDQAQFDQLMAKALAEAQDLEELQGIGKLLGECKGCLEDGDIDEASDRLVALARRIRDFDPNGDEDRALVRDQQDLDELMDVMRQGLGSGPLPGGQRRAAEEKDTKAKLERQRAELDNKTQFMISGVHKGGTFSKIPPKEIGGAFRQAQQDAPEAIERQQVPPDAAEMLRGYYENLGGTKKKQ